MLIFVSNQTHPIFADILNRIAADPAKSPAPEEIDAAMLADKLRDGYAQRQQEQALRLQNSVPAIAGFFN
jgi:hypothetical protein